MRCVVHDSGFFRFSIFLIPCYLFFALFACCIMALLVWRFRKKTFFHLFSFERSNGRGCGRDGRTDRGACLLMTGGMEEI